MNKIIITGAGKGIGRAIASAFAKEPEVELALCARTASDLESFITEHPHIKVHTLVADLSKRDEVERLADFVLATIGTPTVLVNNVGIFKPGAVHQEEEGSFELQMATNVGSAYYLTRRLVPGMIEAGTGHIFNMCSIASITAYPNGGSYCISKHALYGFNGALRESLRAHNIKVTAILPGAVLTDSWAGTDLPPERFIDPTDIALAVVAATKMSMGGALEQIVFRPQLGDI